TPFMPRAAGLRSPPAVETPLYPVSYPRPGSGNPLPETGRGPDRSFPVRAPIRFAGPDRSFGAATLLVGERPIRLYGLRRLAVPRGPFAPLPVFRYSMAETMSSAMAMEVSVRPSALDRKSTRLNSSHVK